MIIWITGRKNSGKTTLASKLAKQLDAVVIDGDEIRKEMQNFDFTESGINDNMRDITKAALACFYKGKNCIIACVSPIAKLRASYQALLPGCIEIELPFGELWPGTTYESSGE